MLYNDNGTSWVRLGSLPIRPLPPVAFSDGPNGTGFPPLNRESNSISFKRGW